MLPAPAARVAWRSHAHPTGRKVMRAIRVHEFGDPDVLRLEELPEPRPVDDEVLVRVQAAGVNPVGLHAHEHFVVDRPWLRQFLETQDVGVAELVHADRSHGLPPGGVSTTPPCYPRCPRGSRPARRL